MQSKLPCQMVTLTSSHQTNLRVLRRAVNDLVQPHWEPHRFEAHLIALDCLHHQEATKIWRLQSKLFEGSDPAE